MGFDKQQSIPVPNSFTSWENEQGRHYLEHVDDPDGIHCDEIFLLEEAITSRPSKQR